MFAEAKEFVREQLRKTLKAITKNHKQLIQQHIEYRDDTELLINERNMLRDRWMTYEHTCAMKSPVMEAEYAHDDTTALSMYDCLIPKLREWRKFRIRPEIKYREMLVPDMKAHQRVLELQFELQEKLLPGLQADNKELKEKVEELEHEAVMVKWLM